MSMMLRMLTSRLKKKEKKMKDTGKSLSETLIFASTNPQYDDRLFIELQVQYMKIASSNLGRTCCVQKLFLTLRTIFVHNMSSPCFAKRRASDKDLPVPFLKFFFFLIYNRNKDALIVKLLNCNQMSGFKLALI